LEIMMAKANFDSEPTLVLGGTGKTGRRVADQLRAMGKQVRIGSRTAQPGFDWDDRSTWAAALRGVHSAHVTFGCAESASAPAFGRLSNAKDDPGGHRQLLFNPTWRCRVR
jgi:uncharacterized protein YbjT (DUF2867 family)